MSWKHFFLNICEISRKHSYVSGPLSIASSQLSDSGLGLRGVELSVSQHPESVQHAVRLAAEAGWSFGISARGRAVGLHDLFRVELGEVSAAIAHLWWVLWRVFAARHGRTRWSTRTFAITLWRLCNDLWSKVL